MWNIAMCWLYAITKYRYIPDLAEIISAIDDAQRLGFKYMELEGVGRQLHIVAENRSKIKKRCDEKGITLIDFVPVLPDLMSPDEKKRKSALKDFRLGCEVASYFETDLVQVDTFHLPIHVETPYSISEDFKFIYKAPSLKVDPSFDFWRFFNDVLVSSVAECNDMAKDHGLKLCIEPRTWENISNTWALELLMREVKSNNLGAVLDVAHLSAMAKMFASDVAMKVTSEAAQILGEVGHLRGNPIEKMMRDAKITQIYEGTNQIQRNIIGLHLLKEAGRMAKMRK